MQAQSSIHHNHFSLKLFHPYNKFITGCVFSISLNPLVSFAGLFSATFYHCVFSNVSSNCLHEKMHNRTGCIFFTFLHCVFSNGPSKHLDQSMHSRIGCICLSFLHCVFSNVSSNRLREKMHNHTGYICSTFLRCVPSDFSPGHSLFHSENLLYRHCSQWTQNIAVSYTHLTLPTIYSV